MSTSLTGGLALLSLPHSEDLGICERRGPCSGPHIDNEGDTRQSLNFGIQTAEGDIERLSNPIDPKLIVVL